MGGLTEKSSRQFRVGDLLLSRDENNPEGPALAKVVEEVFVRVGRVLNLKVAGRVIGTTGEHPFLGMSGPKNSRIRKLLKGGAA